VAEVFSKRTSVIAVPVTVAGVEITGTVVVSGPIREVPEMLETLLALELTMLAVWAVAVLFWSWPPPPPPQAARMDEQVAI
jgi:uncharacterized membrane protein